MSSFAIVAPDTDAGKTWITSHILKALYKINPSAMVMKPVQTGAIYKDGKPLSEDIEECCRIAGIEISKEDYPLLVPYLFNKPCSPHLAAELDNATPIDLQKIKKSFKELQKRYDHLLVETAGGILSPLNWNETNADLLNELRLPTIIVAPNKLGAISQTLSTIQVLKSMNTTIKAIIMNDMVNVTSEFEEMLLAENLKAVQVFSSISQIYRVPFTKNSEKIEQALSPLVKSLLA